MYLNVHAIVLRSERISEKDKRLWLYTQEKGRLLALAAGAAKAGARLAAATEPASESHFRLWWDESKPQARITGGKLLASFPGLRAHWRRMSSALFFCEWTERLTALQQPHPEKYDLLRRALESLQTSTEASVRLAFLIQFLERAGYTVGEDVLGPAYRERWQPWVEQLRGHDFISAPPDLKDSASLLEQQLVKFVSPLLSRPLKTFAQGRAMEKYISRQRPEFSDQKEKFFAER
jgi:hypothetical protein